MEDAMEDGAAFWCQLVLKFPAASKVQFTRWQSGVANPSISNRTIQVAVL
jgi:hypothetical protein